MDRSEETIGGPGRRIVDTAPQIKFPKIAACEIVDLGLTWQNEGVSKWRDFEQTWATWEAVTRQLGSVSIHQGTDGRAKQFRENVSDTDIRGHAAFVGSLGAHLVEVAC
jgi:hypothetical protein